MSKVPKHSKKEMKELRKMYLKPNKKSKKEKC